MLFAETRGYGGLVRLQRRLNNDAGPPERPPAATGMGNEMAKKITRIRPWTKEEVRMLKTLARKKTKSTAADITNTEQAAVCAASLTHTDAYLRAKRPVLKIAKLSRKSRLPASAR
jgi:hypothetical protein